MNFREIACAHLSRYKESSLAGTGDGYFHYRGRDVPKAHILPISQQELNILEPYRESFWKSQYSCITLHRYFHHLNSSQALCINLYYPLIAEGVLPRLLQFLGLPATGDLSPAFEKESELEVAKRLTSFDFHIQLTDSCQVFFEVKYTEGGFGKAKNDEAHRKKFIDTYEPLMRESPFLAPECHDQTFFLEHYQILRNLVHIGDSSYVVLLFPGANSEVAEEAAYARDHLLTDAGRARLRVVFLEELTAFLEKQSTIGPLGGYFELFRTKYLPATHHHG